MFSLSKLFHKQPRPVGGKSSVMPTASSAPQPYPFKGIVGKLFAVAIRRVGDGKKTNLESLMLERLMAYGATVVPVPSDCIDEIFRNYVFPGTIKADYLLIGQEVYHSEGRIFHGVSRCTCDFRLLTPENRIAAAGVEEASFIFLDDRNPPDNSQYQVACKMVVNLAAQLLPKSPEPTVA